MQCKATPTGIRVLSLFGGISVGHDALARAGFKIGKYYAAETNKYALAVPRFSAQPPRDHPARCIRALGPGRLRELGQIGMVLASPPCQGFSNAGLHGEFAHGESALYYDFLRILRTLQPRWLVVKAQGGGGASWSRTQETPD